MKKVIVIFTFLVFFFSCNKNTDDITLTILDTVKTYTPLSNGEIVKHTYYTLSYSDANEQAEWVYYRLTDTMLTGTVTRTDNYRADPFVKTGSAELTDYLGSGYDRGHLCPAGDMTITSIAMSESFYLSNMAPMEASFNRGIWSTLETKVRTWAVKEKELFIVSGGIFKSNKGTIGANEVTVPGSFYKVVYSKKNNKMIGFVIPNNTTTKEVKEFVVPIDSVEVLTDIDFYPQVVDTNEKWLEGNSDINYWFNITSSENYVIICNSSSSYAYHKYICSGLNKCTSGTSNITEEQAKKNGRTPCKICY